MPNLYSTRQRSDWRCITLKYDFFKSFATGAKRGVLLENSDQKFDFLGRVNFIYPRIFLHSFFIAESLFGG